MLFFTVALALLSGFKSFAQNEKCLALANAIIKNTRANIQSQSVDLEEIYYIKAEFSSAFDLESLKAICDTTVKATNVTNNWRLNYDRNYEKEFSVSGNKLLVTIYFNDRFIYFEFPYK
jgi:hypothetical protein